MNEQQFSEFISTLTEIAIQLNRIAIALETAQPEKPAPNYKFSIEKYQSFDWESIGCKVLEWDNDGATLIEWNGHQYKRRSPENKFAPAIWFSRAIGKNEDGSIQYEKLITFKEEEAPEPISRKVEKALSNVVSLEDNNSYQAWYSKGYNDAITGKPKQNNKVKPYLEGYEEGTKKVREQGTGN